MIGGWWAWVDQSEDHADDDEDGEDEEEDFEGLEGGGGAGVEDLHFGVGVGLDGFAAFLGGGLCCGGFGVVRFGCWGGLNVFAAVLF